MTTPEERLAAAGHPVGTGDDAWCHLLVWDPDVPAATRLAAGTPLAHRPGRRAVLADRAASLRRSAPGVGLIATVAVAVPTVVGAFWLGVSLAVAVILFVLGVSTAAAVRAVRRADASATADGRRRALREQLAGQAVDPASLGSPWRELADRTARLQLAVADAQDPHAVAAVDEAAGRVLTAMGADLQLRSASEPVRRAVAAAPHPDPDADALRDRLAQADTARTALVADATGALDGARAVVAGARSGDAAVQAARLLALGDLDRAVNAARALDPASGELRSQDGNHDT